MKADPLKKIARANLVLGVAITALAGVLWGGAGMLGAGVGAALACLNFWAIGRLGRRAVSRVEVGATNGQAFALAAGLLIKMTALFALVWVAVRVVKLPALPFAMGMSVFVFSILLVGLGARPSDQEVEA
jgi:ATP synthase I chain